MRSNGTSECAYAPSAVCRTSVSSCRNVSTRVVRRKTEWRHSLELLPPVAQMLFQHGSAQPSALPRGIVGVLNGQRLKPGRNVAEVRVITLLYFAGHH